MDCFYLILHLEQNRNDIVTFRQNDKAKHSQAYEIMMYVCQNPHVTAGFTADLQAEGNRIGISQNWVK